MEESVALRSYFQAHKQEMIDTLAAWVAVPSVRGDAKPACRMEQNRPGCLSSPWSNVPPWDFKQNLWRTVWAVWS